MKTGILLPLILILMTLAIPNAFSEIKNEKIISVMYFNKLLGHVHSSPLKNSSSVTTISCGHPVKVLQVDEKTISKNWAYVRVSGFTGYMENIFLDSKRVDCFQSRYPKFFSTLNLDLSELYYWGRLYDHYITGDSKASMR